MPGCPLRPPLLDLREHPLCEQHLGFLLSLETLASAETLLVVNDLDPYALLRELRPVPQRGYRYWIPEAGPEIWRILICREEAIEEKGNCPVPAGSMDSSAERCIAKDNQRKEDT